MPAASAPRPARPRPAAVERPEVGGSRAGGADLGPRLLFGDMPAGRRHHRLRIALRISAASAKPERHAASSASYPLIAWRRLCARAIRTRGRPLRGRRRRRRPRTRSSLTSNCSRAPLRHASNGGICVRGFEGGWAGAGALPGHARPSVSRRCETAMDEASLGPKAGVFEDLAIEVDRAPASGALRFAASIIRRHARRRETSPVSNGAQDERGVGETLSAKPDRGAFDCAQDAALLPAPALH